MPDGTSIVLERQQGADTEGYAGLEDEVDKHWGMLFKAAVLSTLLSFGAEAGTGSDENNLAQAIREGASNSISQTGQQIVQRQLNIQPTLTMAGLGEQGRGERFGQLDSHRRRGRGVGPPCDGRVVRCEMHGDAEVWDMPQSTRLKQQTRTVTQIVICRQGAANSCPNRVIRVVLTHSRSLPVFPHKQTCRAATGMSQKCPDSDSCTATNN